MLITSVHGNARILPIALLTCALGLAFASAAPAETTWSVELQLNLSGNPGQRLDSQDRRFVAGLERDLARQVRAGSKTRSQLVSSLNSKLLHYQDSRGADRGSGLVARPGGPAESRKWCGYFRNFTYSTASRSCRSTPRRATSFTAHPVLDGPLELTIEVGGSTRRPTAEETAFLRSLEKELTRKLRAGKIGERWLLSEIKTAFQKFEDKLRNSNRAPTWVDQKVGVTAMLVFTVRF